MIQAFNTTTQRWVHFHPKTDPWGFARELQRSGRYISINVEGKVL
jgi:hypothetical protein